MSPENLEPKIAKMEATIESVTRDIGNLAHIVQGISGTVADLAKSTNEQFEKLLVGITTAAAPRRTDWQVVIAAAVLCLALGAAVLTPISAQIVHLDTQTEALNSQIDAHMRLPLHPVGESRVNDLEKNLTARLEELTKELDLVRTQGTPITSSRLGVLETQVIEISRRINTLHLGATNDSYTLRPPSQQLRSSNE